MAEYYFDHPAHGATVACDTNEAKRLMGYGWVLRDPQPEGVVVPAELLTQPEPVKAPILDSAPEAEVFPVEQPKRRGRPPKAA